MTGEQLLTLLQVIGPPVAVYAAIRSDIAAMKVRLWHLERVVFPDQPQGHKR